MKTKSSPHPVDIHVGKRLRLRRTILGLSQEAVGRAIGITFQQIQKYERGVNRMSASRMHDFAKAMDVPIHFFFEGLSTAGNEAEEGAVSGFAEESSPAFDYEKISSRETLEMMRYFHRIQDPAVRKKCAELIRAIAEAQPEGAVVSPPRTGRRAAVRTENA